MNGIALTLVTLLLLTIAGGFFLLGELEDKFKQMEEDKNKDNKI